MYTIINMCTIMYIHLYLHVRMSLALTLAWYMLRSSTFRCATPAHKASTFRMMTLMPLISASIMTTIEN